MNRSLRVWIFFAILLVVCTGWIFADETTIKSEKDTEYGWSIIDELIYVDGKEVKMTCVSMGNPHCIVFVEDVEFDDFKRLGRALENHKMFPERINVEFVKPIDKSHIRMRVWERGAGETLACGTGACASAVACVLNDKSDRNVTVHLNGGDLKIKWSSEDNCVYMEGPAEFIFRGEWII